MIRSRFAVGALVVATAAAVPTAAATSAAAAPTEHPRVVPASSDWRYIRFACRTVTAGQACVGLLGNGQPRTYQVRYTMLPRTGQWIRPVSWSSYYVHGSSTYSSIQNDGDRRFCSGSCAVRRSPQTLIQAQQYYGVYSFVFATPQGQYEVDAGVTTAERDVDSICFTRLSVHSYLTSTADGTVYEGRQVQVDAGHPTVTRMFENDRSFYTKSFPRTAAAATHFTSPWYYRSWPRHTSSLTPDGKPHQLVDTPYAYLFYNNGASRTYLGADDAEVC